MDEKNSNQESTPPQPFDQPVVFKAEGSSGNGTSITFNSAKTILASFLMLFLVGGVGVGVYLVGQQQQLKSKASNDIPENLSAVVPKNALNTPSPTTQATSAAINSDSEDGSDTSASDSDEDASESAEVDNLYDFSDDGIVNSVDLSVMYSGWGIPQNDNQRKADLNKDGIVNGIDYAIFLPHFNGKAEN